MIKVIIGVGNSLLENTSKYFQEVKNDDAVREDYKEITKADKSQRKEKANRYANKVEDSIKKFFKKGRRFFDSESEWEEIRDKNEYINEDASAEIKSIIEIQKEVGEKIQVNLIASDTVASETCGKLIKYFFEEIYKDMNIEIMELNKIENLQVWNEEKFNTAILPEIEADIIILNTIEVFYIPSFIEKYKSAKLKTLFLEDKKYENTDNFPVYWGVYRDKY